jgi:hypothetical protein
MVRQSDNGNDASTPSGERPFPTSLCHRCAAPPRYVRTDKGSVFLHCPILKRYPAQPVRSCDAFVPGDE